MNIKTIKMFNHKMSNISQSNSVPSATSPNPRVPNCRASPYIMPSSIKTPNSSSIAKKVTDDLFASSAFFGTKSMSNEKYCGFLKHQLDKCVTKKDDCIHIKNMYDELCSSLILTKPA